jgi:hypothetical protein
MKHPTREAALAAIDLAMASGDKRALEDALNSVDALNARASTPVSRTPETATTARGNPIELPSLAELAVAELESTGLSRADALERVAFQPGTLTELSEQIAARREALIAEANAEEDSAWSESPEGRAAAARAAATRAAERSKLASDARILLKETPGMAGDAVDRLSDDDALDISGVLPSAERVARERANSPEGQREQARANFEARNAQEQA